MDPLTAMSFAGTVIQFVDFSGKLISASIELYKKSKLDVHEQAEAATNDILDYSTKLQRELREPGSSVALSEDDQLLESICKGCDTLARDLIARLDKLKVPLNKKGKAKTWPSLTIALQSMWKREELSEIQERLKEYRQQIDSRILRSLSKRIDSKLLEQSKRFDRLDAANQEIAAALINRNASDQHGLQAQISALAALLDRAEAVVSIMGKDNKCERRVIVDVYQRSSSDFLGEENNTTIAEIRTAEQKTQQAVTSEILESLYFTSITERFEAVDESLAKTFDWIFRPIEETSQYADGIRWADFSDWLRFGKGVYWINGKAGSGKSTLMKYILNHHTTLWNLGLWAGTTRLCKTGFFFWNSGSQLQCSQVGLFRALLYDILVQYPELVPATLPAQWAIRYQAKRRGKYCLRESWPLSELKIAFKTLIFQTRTPLKLCLFIDGLDEYEGDEEDVIEIFGQETMPDNVKICCSSRPHQAFEDAFATRPGLKLQDLTIPDMRQYVHDKLEQNPRMRELTTKEPKLTTELIEEIGYAACGVFLWVRLVVSSLVRGLGKHDDIYHLQLRLRELPQELDDLFDKMIFKVDKVYREETAQLFELVGSAFRDQFDEHFSRGTKQLSVLLLSFAAERDNKLALEAKLGFMTKSKATSRCNDMEIYLRTRCGGLIEVKYGDRDIEKTAVSPMMIVSYLHRTVKDYLELRETRQKLADFTGSKQKDSFSASFAIFKGHILMLKAVDVTPINERPPWGLIEDAIMWARRAERDTQRSRPEYLEEFYNITRQFWNDSRMNIARFREVKYDIFDNDDSMLTLAARCGLCHYLGAKLSQDDILKTWGHQRSLLDLALNPVDETFVSAETVETILKHGADPNKREVGSQSCPWENALSIVQEKDFSKEQELRDEWAGIIKALLAHGANPHVMGSVARTQLSLVSTFQSNRRLAEELKEALDQAERDWDRKKMSSAPKETSSGCCVML